MSLRSRLAALVVVPLVLAPLALAAPAHEGTQLRWRGKVGDVQRHRLVSTQSLGTPMGTVRTNYALVVRQEVTAVAADGVGTLALRYEAFRVDSAGVAALNFDSTRTGEAALRNSPEVSAQFAKLAAATITLTVEPSGRVTRIEGLGAAREAAFGPAPAAIGAGSPLRGVFGDEALERLVEVNTFPSDELAVGARWARTQTLRTEPLGTLTFTSQNTLAALESRGARIELEGEVALESAGAGGMSFALTDSDFRGHALVALGNGYLLELHTQSTLDLALSMGGSEQSMTVETAQDVVALAPEAAPFE